MGSDLTFQQVVKELNKFNSADSFEFVEQFVQDLPLDEHQFVANAMEDLEKIGDINPQVTTTEKLRVLSALWAAFKCDKMMQNKKIKKLSESEAHYLDIIRKREQSALNRLSDWREAGGSGKSLEDIMDEFESGGNETEQKTKPDEQKFDIE